MEPVFPLRDRVNAACPYREQQAWQRTLLLMADLRTEPVRIDATEEPERPAYRSVQAMWREENAAFRARVLSQLRQVRQREETA
ncbi:MAG: hypothetical protein ABR614_13300 [Mycobacteriales bacterium]